MIFQNFFKKIFSPMVWGNFLAMGLVLIGILFGLWQWMAWYTHHGESVDVPNVKEMLFDDAQYALGRTGLVAVIADSSYNRSLPPGTVLDQIPASGSKVKSGREIYLTINQRDVPTLPVPDIADNCSLREAEATLKSLGFKLGAIEYVPGDKDWVMDVKCNGRSVMVGERVPKDTPLVLVVGNDDSGTGEELVDDWSDSIVTAGTDITIELDE